jgi:hypothetical protein
MVGHRSFRRHDVQADSSTMPITWANLVAALLSTTSVAWCVFMGGWFWFVPIRYEVIRDGVPAVRYQSFSEVSLLGPAPLIVPVLIAAVAAWAAWRSHRVALGLAAFLLVVFTFISGFSIGGGYLPASALLLAAAVVLSLGSGLRTSAGA